MAGLLLALICVPLLDGGPVQTMESFIDAVYRFDAEAVYGMLSCENQAALSVMLTMARLQPVSAAEEISRQTGRQVSDQEITRWTETDLVRIVLDAPVLVSQLPERSLVSCSVNEMRGDTAIVVCQVDRPSGTPDRARFAMVFQQGQWRVGEPFL